MCLIWRSSSASAWRRSIPGLSLPRTFSQAHRASEILSLALDSHEEFVQVPSVTQAALSSLECPGVLDAELLTLLSDGLVGDYDPALRQKVFNISEAQAESVIARRHG
jgi:hypothetical protein